MRWDERQVAMLREMGVRLWFPQPDPVPGSVSSPLPPAERGVAEVIASQPAAVQLHTIVLDRSQAQPSSSVATLDWPALRETVAACTACKLCGGRRQSVFGVGNPQAHWMIVGGSGQLLDNMLRAVSLTRGEAEPARQVYIANTIKCRPPGNRNPAPDELAKCEPFLIRQVQLVQPKIIVAMGRFAVHSLLRSTEPIGRLRGRVHSYQGVPLIVTYHPAYLLRNPQDKARAWDDLCLAVETADARVPA